MRLENLYCGSGLWVCSFSGIDKRRAVLKAVLRAVGGGPKA